MSIVALSSSYAKKYAKPDGLGGAAPALPDSVMTTLTSYIPTEIVTVYLAGVAAIQSGASSITTENISWYNAGLFAACAVLSPIIAAVSVWVASKQAPKLVAIVFPALAALVAFVAYAAAVPGGFFGHPVFGTLAVLIVTPVLYVSSLAYQRIFPPSNP